MTIYCINPNCPVRENPDDAVQCQSCTTKLLIENTPISSARRQYRLHLIKPASELQLMSYSELFEVIDLETSEIRVLKVLKTPLLRLLEPPMYEKLVSLFKREAEILRNLRHPGIPRVRLDDFFTFDLTTSPNQLYCICMPKIEGITLKQWLKRGEILTHAQALDWLRQIAEILDYVHQNGFFHRDIKPTNIMLQPNGKLMLIDFGGARPITQSYLAKLSTEDNETDTPKFDDVTSLVSMEYSPLEQFNGKALPQSDFYALGRTFIELTTRKKLAGLSIDKQTGYTTWRKYAPQIKKPLADLIDEMVAIAPGDRPKNTRLLLHAINRLETKTKRLKFPSAKVSIGVALISMAVLTGGWWWQNQVRRWQAVFALGEGVVNLSNGNVGVARSSLEKAIKLNPQDDESHYYLAFACAEAKQYDCALEHFQEAIHLAPENPLNHYELGRVYDEQQKYALAEQQYQVALELDPRDPYTANNLARLKILAQDYDAAIQLIKQSLSTAAQPNIKAIFLKNLGWAALMQKKTEVASKYLEQARQLDPSLPDTYCLLNQITPTREYQEGCISLPSEQVEVRQWRLEVIEQLKAQK